MKKMKLLSRFSGLREHQELPPQERDLAGRPAGPPGQEALAEEEASPDQEEPQRKDPPWMPLAVVASKYVLLVVAIWFVFSFVFSVNQMSGETMYPRLRDGDLLLSYRLERSYEADDVVLYDYNGLKYVSRVVAQAGDVVDVSEDGCLVINGNVEQEEVFYATEAKPGGIEFPYTVPEDSYFVLCDYRTAAADSRNYGAISKADIIGKVITVLRRRSI